MIVLAYDHRGYEIMKKVEKYLVELGHEVKVCASEPYDGKDSYTKFALEGNDLILKNKGAMGIYCCRTGIGISIMANRRKGIKAGLCHDEETVWLARNDDDINVLVIPCGLKMTKLKKMINTFLNTQFEGGRHQARVDEYDKY